MTKAYHNPEHGIIAHGSDEHKALLGITEGMDPDAKAKLEAALNAGPPPTMNAISAKRKTPINKRTWPSGKEMFDGWKRQGR